MLAKISWRLLKDPSSLLGRILFGKYCLHTPFLKTPAANGISHGWRGILLGRDLLSKGLGWALGSGHNVNIWTEPWLSTSAPIIPIGPPTRENQSWKVSNLIVPDSNEWNIECIRDNLPQYEEAIRRLVPSSFHMEDERVWLPNASGMYTTRSGYAIAKLYNGNDADRSFVWKKCVWQATSPKIKQFLWKANSKALPVGSLLESRGLIITPTCRRCGAQETEIHVLLHCPFVLRVWELAPCIHKPLLDISSVAQLLQQCRRMLSLPPTGLGATPLYPWILWTLWTNRNKLLFENLKFSEENCLEINSRCPSLEGCSDTYRKAFFTTRCGSNLTCL